MRNSQSKRGSGSKRRRTTAGELANRLRQDPAYLARVEEQEKQRQSRAEEHAKVAAPIISELQEAGYGIRSLDELRLSGTRYTSAVPILLKWLSRISAADVKESIVRTLSVPWAKPLAAKPLIQEFHSVPKDAHLLRWAIGNALEVIADDSVSDDIITIVSDPANGIARQMFVLALSKVRNPKAIEVLINLLKDDEVAGHAIEALGKLKATGAKPVIEKFLVHPKAWLRSAARKALARIEKA